MARLVWLVFMTAIIGALLAGASFGVAYLAVGDALGAPPPDMGRRSVDFLWDGMPKRKDHPEGVEVCLRPDATSGRTPTSPSTCRPRGRCCRPIPPTFPS